MIELWHYEFMRNAVFAALLVSVACGIVGTFVVIKRIVFISGGITHAAFGGIGLGYFLGINPIAAAIPFSLLSALGIGIIGRRIKISEDSAIGIIWTVGMALGILFIGLTPGYAPDLFSYLFGSILTVTTSDLWIMFALDLVIISAVLVLFKELQAISFDEEFSAIVGVPAKGLYLLLLLLVALSIIVLIRVVGVILVIALLTIPTVIARQFTNRLKKLMLFSILSSVIFTMLGLWLSYSFNLPSGAAIVLLLAFVFFISAVVKRAITKLPLK
ncbi:MAG TPA: metal ABC transporter permease [bacterium]|mgnify:CR=1 FL=1|nr:metal ABC transporter permease [bacterium]